MARKKWLIGIGLVLVTGVITVFSVASVFARRFEPYIREQAIEYLRKRFDSEVELTSLRVRLPNKSSFALLRTGGRGVVAKIEGRGLLMRHKGRVGVPPMFAMKSFSCEIDLGTVFETQKIVRRVTLEGMDINIPPKGERPRLVPVRTTPNDQPPAAPSVIIQEVTIGNATLVILPKDSKKTPLEFYIHRARLESIGAGQPMKYDADLTNPKPPGETKSQGTFGPWAADEPGRTPITGDYTFQKADLGVFTGIAGILNSTGRFDGSLASIHATGTASVPDFRLKMTGNPVPLTTRFEVLVDGTNGNTTLKPVIATLGSTRFTTSGGVIKHEGDARRTVSLDVSMPAGNVRDLLRLGMKGAPFMEGKVALETRIDIPPLTGKVREKLVLDGRFELAEAKFLKSTVQNQIDQLSRRGQGEPKNEKVDDVLSWMAGDFLLENEVITFRSLMFGVPGANVQLSGNFDMDDDALDLNGTLKLQAKVSQTMSGWKRWALKPVDPFFSQRGAGTFLRIKVNGNANEPKFGLDRGRTDR
jgi:hypothetical protein